MIIRPVVLSALTMLAFAGAAQGQTINWASSADSLTLDPHSQNERPTHTIGHQIYEPLVYRDLELELAPALATDWHVSDDDPDVWVFELREGVKFHEGQDMTAEDVVFSLERALHENSDMRGLLTSVAEVRAAGSHTVEIVTDGPNPLLQPQQSFHHERRMGG